MQVRCGQCGMLFETEPHPKGASAACPSCTRVVPLPGRQVDTQIASLLSVQAEEGFAELAQKGLNQKIRMTCGSCGRPLTVGSRSAGKRGRCPTCKGKILIPFPKGHEDFDAAVKLISPGDMDRLDLAGQWQAVTEAPIQEVEVIAASPARRSLLAIAVIVVIGGAVGLWIGMLSRSRVPKPRPTEEPPAGGAVSSADGAGRQAVPRPPVTPVPPTTTTAPQVVRPSPPAPVAETRPAPPPPAVPQATCHVATSRSDIFASGRYVPARPGYVYWKISASLKAGEAPLEFRTDGSDATLQFGAMVLPSLGVERPWLGQGGAFGREAVRIEPGQSRDVTFVFEAPEQRQMGVLNVKGFPEASVGWLSAPDLAGVRVVGAYVEDPPRNLRPVLRDPVMRAIQSAGGHRLLIENGPSGLRAEIPASDVAGAVRGIAPGLYALDLRHGEHELACKLRLIEGGKRAVLYLADEPFHQVTYRRE